MYRTLFSLTFLLAAVWMVADFQIPAAGSGTQTRSQRMDRVLFGTPWQDEEATPIDWSTNAKGFEGEAGRTFRLLCPAAGIAGTIYGTGIYTDDSSICTAAVHLGVISLERGGIVMMEIRDGRSSYESTTRHGIRSNNWGRYTRSFIIKDDGARVRRDRRESDGDNDDLTPIQWYTNATGFTGEEGQVYRFRCPDGGTAWNIYGTDVYTDDSSICTAAVHAGLISLASGGKVTIEIRGGRASYASTNRHGVRSRKWGRYSRSFVFR